MQKLNAYPDSGGNSSQAALINRAYAALSNTRKRADYDCDQNHESELVSIPIERAALPQGGAKLPILHSVASANTACWCNKHYLFAAPLAHRCKFHNVTL